MIKRILVVLLSLPLLGVALLSVTGHGYILTAVSRTYLKGHPTANIDDHQFFETRTIRASDPEPWPLHPESIGDDLPQPLLDYMDKNEAVAFLAIHKGQVFAEYYEPPYDARSRTNSFSMAKTVITMLLGIAIDEGFVSGLDQPITTLLPEFSDDPLAENATIGSLSSMTSGYDWDEHYYSPFSPTVALLYSHDVGKFILNRGFSHEPETHFYYSSASTQLLTLSLERALRKQDPSLSVSEYLSRKLWQPLGMNDDAVWHLDGTGMELGYCCLNTNARNYAKLGQLMLQHGMWNGEQLLPRDFVERMRTPGKVEYYGYSTWIHYDNDPEFYAFRGHLGQYIVVVPEKDLIIVRLGHQHPVPPNGTYSGLPFYIDQIVPLLPEDASEAAAPVIANVLN
ncbi:MAG: serine hydrolase [Pseudomonadota bacterium]